MKKVVLIILFIAGVSYSQTTFIRTGATTILDLQSNGTPLHIIQDRNNPDYIHAVYTSCPYADTTFTDKKVLYYLSTDRGLTWNFVCNIPASGECDFPSLSILSTGAPIVSVNVTNGSLREIVSYVDAFPGLGSFINLGTSSCKGAFPVMTAANNVSQTNKFHILRSTGFSSGLSLTTSSYTPCLAITNIFGFSDNISMAESQDGKVGIAYVSDMSPGDVYLLESPDNGQTFGTPLKIYDAVINTDKTFLGGYKGLRLIYNNNTPNIVFEVAKQNVSDSIFTNEPCGVRYWSPLLPGIDPNRSTFIARNDSNTYSNYIPFYKTYGNDELTSICRPSIGAFTDSNYLAVVFMAASQNWKNVGADTIRYNDIYISYSSNKGLSWNHPKKLNSNSQLSDWTYPSISPFNYSSSGPYYYANISATKDSVPGTYLNNHKFGKSLAEQNYIKAGLNTDTQTKISTTSGNIKYEDNNQTVTEGIVKVLNFDSTSGNIVTVATAPIDQNGNYEINFITGSQTCYIVAYPNSEKTSDFIPTFYPETIDWQHALTINPSNNNPNTNIGVFRKNSLDGSYNISGKVVKLQPGLNAALPQATLYIKSGNNFVDFAETNIIGRYIFSALPNGSYEVIATKLGFSTSEKQIQVNNTDDSVNFALQQILINLPTVSNIIPEKYYLYQNYPNPFNPVTNIKFDIPQSSYVTIKIYNVLGKEVAVILNGIQSAGSYRIDFDASGLSSGIYFYRLETQSFTETKRMVILK